MGQGVSTHRGNPAREAQPETSPTYSGAPTDGFGADLTVERSQFAPRPTVIRHRRRYTWLGQGDWSSLRGDFSSRREWGRPTSTNSERPTTENPSGTPSLNERSPSLFDNTTDGSASQVTLQSPHTLLTDRRASFLSRLGARVAPRSAATEATGATEDVESSRSEMPAHRRRTHRLSIVRSSSRDPYDVRRLISTVSRRSRSPSSERAPTDIPYSWLRPTESALTLAPEFQRGDAAPSPSAEEGPLPRASRLARVRSSILQPLPQFLQNFSNRSRRLSGAAGTPSLRPTAGTGDVGSRPILPWLPSSDTGLDLEHMSLPPDEGASSAPPEGMRSASNPEIRSSTMEGRARRLQNTLRRGPPRPSVVPDQATVLSQLLSVAAAATAATLVGNTERAFSEAHDVAGAGVDGSFDGFLQALQNGGLATALRNGGNVNGPDSDTPTGQGGFTPVNFFRMFRFGATTDSTARNSGTSTPADEGTETRNNRREGSWSSPDEPETSRVPGGSDSRMVPVIIVGIRSLPPVGSRPSGEGLPTPPIFDALANLPLNVSNTGIPRGGSGTLMRRTDRPARFPRSRRASMSAVNYDSPRHQRGVLGYAQPAADVRPVVSSTLPTVLSDSPPGPHPPPSTPADYGLSAYPSGNSTPNRRPSSASASGESSVAGTLPSWRESPASSLVASSHEAPSESTPEPPLTARRRRLSDSEFARHRDLGSGSSRRNGFVGDSDAAAGSRRSPRGSRSWIIYVLGGSYPEDHPILTTPSLFTDSPTYEDMLLLASILGPGKPPVATEEELASAPAAYKVRGRPGALVAERPGAAVIQIPPGDRCLVCLCDYELEEEIRQLTKCGHLYHRTCIDEWLTTGRNSCPLCRGQGVDEKPESIKDSSESIFEP